MMTIFQITRSGLVTIAVLVVILCGCVFAERSLVRQSRRDQYRALRDLRVLKVRRSIEPASAPAPVQPLRPRLQHS